jgi:hypothetical protein
MGDEPLSHGALGLLRMYQLLRTPKARRSGLLASGRRAPTTNVEAQHKMVARTHITGPMPARKSAGRRMTPDQTFRKLVNVFATSWNAPTSLDKGLAELEAEADEAALDRAHERFRVFIESMSVLFSTKGR